MPNYYAHLKFGGKVLALLPAGLAEVLAAERTAFDLGCLGPDPLFFYHILHPSAVRREGLELHSRSALEVCARLRASVEEGVPMARGYGAGFLCHLALDSACHAYVYRKLEDGVVTHMAMEGEFDRMLMERDGLKPLGRSYLPRVDDPAVWTAAAAVYEHVSPHKMEMAYRAMVRYTGMLARCHGRRRAVAVEAVSHLPGCGSIRGITLKQAPHPAAEESNAELLRRLEGAVPESARQIGGFFAAVEQGIPIPKWFDRDFKGNLPERPEPCLGEAVHQH